MKHFSLLKETNETLFTFCQKHRKNFSQFVKKMRYFETVFSFVEKNETNWILSKKLKHFSHFVEKSESFLQLVENVETFFAAS